MGLLEPYTPKDADKFKPAFHSGKNPMTWTGLDAWLAVMCYNTVEGEEEPAEARLLGGSRESRPRTRS